ncbi:membrane protein insertion efficiency factor YidD [Candidatus Shapirobacteria bacterium]|nr:membrane protein insertion efficiency factor YidD [Candidatus Shapirobacteria bacterium]
MKNFVLRMLVMYKKYFSRGYNCRFVPTCSEYTYEAVEKYGVVKGLWWGVKRLAKCHPWGKSGIDLLK